MYMHCACLGAYIITVNKMLKCDTKLYCYFKTIPIIAYIYLNRTHSVSCGSVAVHLNGYY